MERKIKWNSIIIGKTFKNAGKVNILVEYKDGNLWNIDTVFKYKKDAEKFLANQKLKKFDTVKWAFSEEDYKKGNFFMVQDRRFFLRK